MKKPNIDFVIRMTRDYLDEKIDSITYVLDFPYEVEKRYRAMVKEDRVMAEFIFDNLVMEGASLYNVLSDEELRSRIQKEYDYLLSEYWS